MSSHEPYRVEWMAMKGGQRQLGFEATSATPISLMPGPVNIHPAVAASYRQIPQSHRSAAFVDAFENVRMQLSQFFPGMAVSLFSGSGTSANDAVAANLRACFGTKRGLILTNGEFGDRLVKQAARSELLFDVARFPWGSSWLLNEVENVFSTAPAWIWAVHLETSTGVLNDVESLLTFAERLGCFVALDCVSSLGACKTTFSSDSLIMASAVSGKAIGAYAGLAFVYLADECISLLKGNTLPFCFDLCHMHEVRGPLFTMPSSLLFALSTALSLFFGSEAATNNTIDGYCQLGREVRRQMSTLGHPPLAHERSAAPTIMTFRSPNLEFANSCLEAGYLIAHESEYLKNRQLAQIATMGDISLASIQPLFKVLRQSIK